MMLPATVPWIICKNDIKKEIAALEEAKNSDLGITVEDEDILKHLKLDYKSTKSGLLDLSQSEVLKKVIVGWAELYDEEKNLIEYSHENLNYLLEVPQALSALSEAFWAALFKVKEKN